MKAKFYIVGKESQRVVDVGCRVKIHNYILTNPAITKGIVRNIEGENKVEVIIETEGGKEELEKVRQDILKMELPSISKNPGFTITELDMSEEVQKVMLPSLERSSNALIIEQLDKSVSKFIEMQGSLGKTMKDLPKDMATELSKVLKK